MKKKKVDKSLGELLDKEGIDPATHDFSGGNRPFDLDEYYKIITPSLVFLHFIGCSDG